MVDVEVGHNVILGNLSKPSVVSPTTESSKENRESDVRRDDLSAVAFVEDGRGGLEVVGPLGVRELSGRVPNEVEGPAEKLLGGEVEENDERSIVDGLEKLGLPLLSHVESVNVLLGLIEGGVVELLSGSRDEDLVSSEVASRGVMPPRWRTRVSEV